MTESNEIDAPRLNSYYSPEVAELVRASFAQAGLELIPSEFAIAESEVAGKILRVRQSQERLIVAVLTSELRIVGRVELAWSMVSERMLTTILREIAAQLTGE